MLQPESIFIFLFMYIIKINAVPPDACFANFRWDDCGRPPKRVLYYWKPGSRCEVGIWRGCLPNLNMFHDEYECVNTCIFTARAQPDDYHKVTEVEETEGSITKYINVTISISDDNVTTTEATEAETTIADHDNTTDVVETSETTTVANVDNTTNVIETTETTSDADNGNTTDVVGTTETTTVTDEVETSETTTAETNGIVTDGDETVSGDANAALSKNTNNKNERESEQYKNKDDSTNKNEDRNTVNTKNNKNDE
ncbi:myb-like protein D [Maniola jurtina]|uniref:myb-like protein D n=1 Tax=Maniola jurtina TaxID=191418 RepID=UPI001E6865F7|nr:myb-like protein D [Maniola jurtina]